MNFDVQVYNSGEGYHKIGIIGPNLSEPHTSGTALQDVCVCMYVYGSKPCQRTFLL